MKHLPIDDLVNAMSEQTMTALIATRNVAQTGNDHSDLTKWILSLDIPQELVDMHTPPPLTPEAYEKLIIS